ncbi:MAG: hypothetical protein ACRCZP_11785 [Phycicoccus sp.]
MTVEHRRQLLALRAGTLRDFLTLWPALDPTRLDATFDAWLTGVAALVARDRSRANALAVAYLRAIRVAVGAQGAPVVRLPRDVPLEQLRIVLGTTAVATIKRKATAGVPAAVAAETALVASSGEVTKFVLAAARDTVRESAVADPTIVGWRRVGPGSCDFCRMLIGRGAVYTDRTVRFASHAHCSCAAEPAFGGVEPTPVQAFQGTTRTINDVDRARVRRYLADNRAG